jgi:Rrf2 family transcriptional regulator, iron-sulfur cluster assembly transcription factor
MMFSKSCEYAIKAVLNLCIATKDGGKISIHEIADAIESPEPFTAKILQLMVKYKIISSSKGPGGGYYIDKKANPIVVMDIVNVIDGKQAFERCGLGLKKCDGNHPCPIHDQFINYSQQLNTLLEKKTIQEFSAGILAGKTFISNF